MKNANLFLLLIVAAALISSQAPSSTNETFFDGQTIIAMIIGAVFGAAGTWLFQKRKEA